MFVQVLRMISVKSQQFTPLLLCSMLSLLPQQQPQLPQQPLLPQLPPQLQPQHQNESYSLLH